MQRMRSGIIVLATIAAAMTATSAAHADPYKWCAVYSGRDYGATNCGFITYKQCLDTISGIGGYCTPNPFYTGPEAQPRKRKRRK